ncbi:hypothetical protein CEB94_00125 [Streptomyces hawaiiensis]|uniref:Uncharacterized protein n=1 Tax=Streptomyces hawaiiensis TaxID=67305 RepID=A0A6G5R7B7_9ACTN|nr:hypothetical protein CEB94_00125 [Streptomyces hawaiiensis]
MGLVAQNSRDLMGMADFAGARQNRNGPCGCPGRTRPGGRTGSAGPRWSRCSPQGKSERADLVSFQLDDRSQAGITNVWLTHSPIRRWPTGCSCPP